MSFPGTSTTPGRLSATNTGDNNSYRTALQGASLAFQRTGPRQATQPTSVPRTPGNGNDVSSISTTSSAAHSNTSAGRRSPTHPRSGQVSRHATGNSHTSADSSIHGGFYEIQHSPAAPQRHSHISQALTPSHGASLLVPQSKPGVSDPKSPSFIAATLAASRSNSPSPRQSQTHTPIQSHAQHAASRRRPMDGTGAQSGSAAGGPSLGLASGPDETSLPSANALISLFEKREDNTDPVKKTHGRNRSQAMQPPPKPDLRLTTPPRTTSPVLKGNDSPSRQASSKAWKASASSPRASEKRSSSARSEPTRTNTKKKPPTPPPSRTRGGDGNERPPPSKTKQEERPARSRPVTPPPRTISRSQTVIISPQPTRVASQTLLATGLPKQDPAPRSKPAPTVKPKAPPALDLSPSRQRAPLAAKPNPSAVPAEYTLMRKVSVTSNSSNDTFVSASSAPSPGPDSPRRRPRPLTPSPPRLNRPASAVGITARPPVHKLQTGPRHHASSDAALNSLTSAIVAGSLASARATPTPKAKTPPTPPTRHQTPRLKKTLRQPTSKHEDESAEQRYKKHRLRSNKKHSHNEGSRKRWRDEITARERKRYEGVWASNRGRLLQQHQHYHHKHHQHSSGGGGGSSESRDAESIVNVVARDIWARSRLPFDELAEVWDLVDRSRGGCLDKAEFVVGMWLIDQRLRGRKIPQKVSDSVWSSAKGFEVVVGHPSKHKR